jgi:hypothetical protein
MTITTTLDLEGAINALYSGKRLRLSAHPSTLGSGVKSYHTDLVWRSPACNPPGVCHVFSSEPKVVPLEWADDETCGVAVRRYLEQKLAAGWIVTVQGSVQSAKKVMA